MSMLTMQADKLRSWADQLSEREDEFGVVVHALVADLREAADTIENLRDRLQGIECPKDSEGQRIDVADTIHMLRSEYDGDHEWEDVVIELSYCKYGGDKWIVRGARGDAWACDCTVTGHDDELYDKSDDWENLPTPWDAEQPCFAMQADYEHCKYSTNRGWCDTSRYAELFGTPEQAARTLEQAKGLCNYCDVQACAGDGGECRIYDYDALLEWLKQEVEA